MKFQRLFSAVVLACLAFASSSFSVHAQSGTNQKSEAERLKTLNEQKRKIDRETERRTDQVRDGQKGLANSGATQKKIEQIEREQNARKKALDAHYRKGSQSGVFGLDGKRKGSGQTTSKPPTPGKTGAEAKKNTVPQKSEYVVGTDGKLKKRER